MGEQTGSQIRATANDHMRRDLETGSKWVCTCDACREIRSLTSLDKMLDVWPLVRDIQQIEGRLDGLADASQRQNLLEQYFRLYDKLAQTVARQE
jgi:hypothetical protein